MKGAIKKGWKKILVLAMTCVFSASTMGGLYESYSQASETLRGNAGASASVSAGADDGNLSVNRLTNVSDVSLSSEYALRADGEVNGVTYADDDIITVIVKLKDESLLSKATYDAGMDVDEFALTEEGIRYNRELEKSRDGFIGTHSSKLLSVGYEYSTIFNGFAANIYYKSLSALEKDPNVESVLISETYNKPATVTENEVTVYDTGIYDSSDLDYDGSGTVVAILDTGLDYTHTAFQNQPTGDLALTLDDVTAVFDDLSAKQLDAANANNVRALRPEDLYNSDKVPFTYDYADSDADVYPVNDHGTHVAGIIAGKDDVITGVATQAQLAIFKVFGNEDEGAPQEAILAALNDAILLGVDAINMSLGSSCGFSRETDEDATNEIYDAIKESGICLLVAASNSYSSAQGSPNGDTNLSSNPDSATIGSPSTYDAAMSVASISGVKTKYIVADGEEEIYFTEGAELNGDTKDFVGELLAGKTEGTFDYVVVPGVGSDSNYSGIDVKGKIAVVSRGTTTFEEKIDAAERRGAVAVIIYNNVSGVISMSVGDAKIPACSIQMDYGNYLVSKGSGTMHLSTEYLAGPFMSNFSSWGPKPDLELSPDITAHGGEIYSAVRGGYDTYSGTSMACPNMAGATILVREYVKQNYPELSSYEITELTYQLMMSTATIARNEEGNPYSPRKQGSGLADIANAIDTAAYLYVEGQNKTKLSLGDDVDKTGEYTLTFHLKNLSGQAVSYRLDPVVMTETMSSDGKTVAEKAYMFEDSAYEYSVKNGTIKGDVVSVGGYGDCEITVKITLSSAAKEYLDKNFANGMYVEGFVRLLSMNADGIGLNIPYLAFYGDWTQAPLLDVTAYEVGASQEDDSILEDDKLEPDVYATVPMGGFRYSVSANEYEETYYYLGGFGYTLADGYEMPAIIEDKAAISNNMDATYSLYCISAGLLRNAKYAEMQIVDSLTGEVVFTKTSENNRKSYSNGGSQVGGYVDVGFYVNDYHLENNRKYTYSMVCYLDYDEHEQHNLKNTFSFSFYIDNEAPTLVEENTRIRVNTDSNGEITSRALNMYVYDNHYIQGYFIYTYSSISPDGTVNDQEALIDGCIPVDGERNTTTSVSLDITNIYADILEKGGKLMVEILDYAKNRSTYTIDLNTAAKDVTDIQLSDENRDSYTLRINRQVNLKSFIDVYPQNTYVKDLLWTSSDESVAIVKDGLVTGLKAGTTTITVSNGTGEGAVSVQIKITVTENNPSDQITLSALKLKTNAVTLERGESYELTVEMQPYNLTEDIHLTWSTTSNYFTLEVDPEDQTRAIITARESGSGTVVVRADGKTISASCRVTVQEEFELEGHYLKSYTGRGDENGVVEVPDDLGITYIYRYAFFGNDYITKIILPEGLEVIEEAAIYNCENLKEVVFPESTKQINRFAVAWNPELTTVTGKIPSIGELAFYNCPKLETIDLTGTMFIGENAFFGDDALTSIDLSNTVYVGSRAFGQCASLSEVITGDDTVIGSYAFYGCKSLTSLEINSSKIGAFAFANCSNLDNVTFNNAVDTIDDGAFYYCTSLREANFRSTVRVIGSAAFDICTALKSVVIPAGLEELGSYAFADCHALTEVIFSATAKLSTIGEGVFAGSPVASFRAESGARYLSVNDGILYDKGMHVLKLVPYAYAKDVTVPDTVTEVGEYAFSRVSEVKTVDLGGVEVIGTGAFGGSSVENVSLASVRTIGDYAFSQSAITGLVLPEGVESIGANAFEGCENLAAGVLTLPESLQFLGEYAFAKTKGLEGIRFNSALKEIGAYTFYESADLASIGFGSVTYIGDLAFYGCTALTSVVVPDQVTGMGEGVFRGCTALTSAVLPSGMSSVPLYTFYGCTALTSVTAEGADTVGEYAFYGCESLNDFGFEKIAAVGMYAFVGTDFTSLSAPVLKTVGSAAFASVPLRAVSLPEATEIYSYAFNNCGELTGFSAPKLVTLGAYALAGTGISSFESDTLQTAEAYAFADNIELVSVSLPALVNLGDRAFSGTGITTFEVGAALAPEASDLQNKTGLIHTAFVGAQRLSEITVAAGNELFESVDGVLYRHLTVNDGTVVFEYLELVAYPANKPAFDYEVKEDTLRVGSFAFYGAGNLESVVLPDTLQSIGSSAFENCVALTLVDFRSAQAPALEGMYDAEGGVVYKNFVGGIDTASERTLNAIVPSNAVGYDTYIWTAYFGSVTNSSTTAVTQNTMYLIKLIDTIPDAVTEADRANVEFCRRMYNSFNATQQGFVTNLARLEAAEDALGISGDTPAPGPDDSSSSSSSSDTQSSSGTGTSSGKGSGCGSAIGLSVFALFALAAGCTIAVKSRRKD